MTQKDVKSNSPQYILALIHKNESCLDILNKWAYVHDNTKI